MKTNWLWDKDVTEEQAKAILADTKHPRFTAYAALFLSRTNSARDVFRDFLSRENFFVFWPRIKKQMRKDSWNNPSIDYWQAIYETLKEEMPEFKKLKALPPESAILKESEFSISREIGSRIKVLREESGLKQKDLAKRLKISQQIISRIESGRQNVSVETLNEICEKLGVPVASIFHSQSEESERTVNIFPFSSKSPEEFVKIVYETIERSKEYSMVQYYDGISDKGRDVLAYKYVGKREQWYFQCKRYNKIHFLIFKDELDKIVKHCNEDKNFHPDGIVFVSVCKITAQCKDKTKEYAKEVGLGEVLFWTDVELTVKAKATGVNDELLNNLNKAEYLVFDYASLLNISKMNLLGHLEKFRKKILVSRELFNKVQSELLTSEQEDLRNVWRFLKSSGEIDIVENVYSAKKEGKYSGMFDEWLIDSIRIAKEKNATFVIDDLRLIEFFRSEEKLNMCNSFIILKSMLSRGWIDAKMYSTSLGDLAERFYIFLPFSGDDLFQIVMEDKSKVTLRSSHLVNQMFLSGSDVKSFASVFVRFIDLLWKTGSLPEDKVNWFRFLAQNVIKFLEEHGGIQDDNELNNVVPDFVQMWIIAVQKSNKDEILLLENQVDKILEAPAYNMLKDNVSRFIKAKKTSLGMA